MNSYQRENKISIGKTANKFVMLLLALGLAACGGSITGDSVGNGDATPQSTTPTASTSGNPDIGYFYNSLYFQDTDGNETGVLRKYCSTCHVQGNITPSFADDDVDHAYDQVIANNLVDFVDIASSRFVTKVSGGNGHNCWPSTSPANCASNAVTITTQIQAWINLRDGNVTNNLSAFSSLKSPTVIAEATVSKSLPTTTPAEFTGVYNLLAANCNGCHIATSATPQQPYFADGDIDVAYAAVVSSLKIDVNTPDISRIYLRLAQDSHNCWTVCSSDSAELLTAITTLANAINVDTELDPNMVPSKALLIEQGTQVGAGVRYDSNLIAKFEFKEGTGTVANDTSSTFPLTPINLNENVSWIGGWGIDIKAGGQAIASVAASQKLYSEISKTNAFSIEAWVIPARTDLGTAVAPSPIVSYSAGPDDRNFTLGQAIYNYTSAVRIDQADADMTETLATPDADEALQASQQHVVMTYDDTNGRRIYVNGELASQADAGNIGALSQWNSNYILSLGAETDGSNQWEGKIRFLAIHNAALTQEQIALNVDAGVGVKYNLLFKVGHLDDDVTDIMPDQSYIWFIVSEFDDFSYLFASPYFVIMNSDGNGAIDPTDAAGSLASAVNMKGIKLGMNGKEVDVGQVFTNVNIDVTASQQSLIPLTTFDFGDGEGAVSIPTAGSGTVIAKQNGATGSNADQFFLSFEEIAGKTGISTDPTVLTFAADQYPGGTDYVVGLRTFDELNMTMAQLTGVDATTLSSSYANLKQQLPSKEDVIGFLASMQMSVANLAGLYCQALVEDNSLRSGFFGVPESFFTTNPGTINAAFGTGLSATKLSIVNALVTKFTNQDQLGDAQTLNIQPTATDIRDALIGTDGNGGLYGTLQTTCATDSCTENAARVRTVVKGMCMGVLGSSAVTMQ